jgi:uroporphyrinogen-III synthase
MGTREPEAMTEDASQKGPPQPLKGRRILVTRRPAQASRLAEGLAARGATVIEVPAIETVPPGDTRPIDAALLDLPTFDWLIFTSANAVRFTRERCDALGLAPDVLARGPSVAVVGPATAAVLTEHFPGARVERMPEGDFRAEGLLAALADVDVAQRSILMPAAERARDVLPRALTERGASVRVVVAYRTVAPPGLAATVAGRLREGIDVALFASPSAVENFAAAAGDLARRLPVVVMGPVTEQAARDAGMDVKGVALPSTVEGLVEAAVRALESGPVAAPREGS